MMFDPSELPYGDAFLFIDQVIDCEADVGIETAKRYSADSPIIAAHFRNGPKIVPGVVLVEQICQSALLLGLRSGFFSEGRSPLLAEVKSKFLRSVIADCTVHARVNLGTCLRDAISFDGQACCEGVQICKVSGLVVVRSYPS